MHTGKRTLTGDCGYKIFNSNIVVKQVYLPSSPAVQMWHRYPTTVAGRFVREECTLGFLTVCKLYQFQCCMYNAMVWGDQWNELFSHLFRTCKVNFISLLVLLSCHLYTKLFTKNQCQRQESPLPQESQQGLIWNGLPYSTLEALTWPKELSCSIFFL